MPHTTAIPTGLLAELRHFHRHNPSLLDEALPGLRLRPLTGGRNNRVFAWDSPDGEVCLKLYRTDKRDRAACEYQALTHVAACGVTAAPRPLWHDPDPELPAVAMSMVPGQPVPELAEPTSSLPAVVAVLGSLRELPLGPFVDIPRVDSATTYMKRIIEVWPGQLDEYADEPVTADMRSLLDAWHEHDDAAVLAEPAPRIFSRGDSNLLNWLWHEPDVRVVDWEFVGYSDTAYDAAELVEHPSAHAIDDERWISLLPDLGINDDTTRRRFLAAQRTVALRWLSVLWKRRNKRADEFEYQVKRVRELMNHDYL
ncbi:aminoglycoside phosphotransferase family protein [Amycolatopsis cihanbeyliensis]|uniref:Aminoglycoside phosphotransferase (APT) family kinase protein n=1 Tax=Amycolatopsis cihanbeyliensis TaxID=1128664 RepID=A0A542DQ67_AMYCI|nr:aminoglycoside phosphotransferase family protein [Amycolatopsis cihanbeyliensis]TQJ05095.1 aminoglycoside phosphotransferase (APT) family kinase protein [Amycolatopsis cihanbeyliensis]